MSFVRRTIVLSLFIIPLGGCGLHAVRPYERSHLNTQTMQADQDSALSAQRQQALGLREAMRDGRGDDVAARR
jgi:hypothetical protein